MPKYFEQKPLQIAGIDNRVLVLENSIAVLADFALYLHLHQQS